VTMCVRGVAGLTFVLFVEREQRARCCDVPLEQHLCALYVQCDAVPRQLSSHLLGIV
jgi:hypothetical protein